ncbi:c-type cytochrome [Pseudomonadota bacterium]
MKNFSKAILVIFLLPVVSLGTYVYAKTTVDHFMITGLISPAGPKTLKGALESKLKVKVVKLDLNHTSSGWPEMSIEYDSSSISRDDIEKLIGSTEDPAGHKYGVYKGKLQTNAAMLKEEEKAMAALGPKTVEYPKLKNPITSSAESTGRGKTLYDDNCARCHAMDGSGNGPTVHAFTTSPRQLWTWYNADSSVDGYLFWFITNGRSDMPPWGIVFSENQRWDLVNYIKTLKKPAK